MKKEKRTFRITEAELRAWQKCSALFSFGGSTELPWKTHVLDYVYTKLVLDILKNPAIDFKFALSVQLNNARKYLKLHETLGDNEAEEILRHTAINMNELLTIIRPHAYVPVFGSFEYPVKIGNGLINLRVSSILASNINAFETKGRTYHAVTFSPHSFTADMERDMVQTLKIMTLGIASPFKGKKINTNVPFKLHIVSTNTKPGINYTVIESSSSLNQKYSSYFEDVFSKIEEGFQIPLSPCMYLCPFKTVCGIDPKRKRELNYEPSIRT